MGNNYLHCNIIKRRCYYRMKLQKRVDGATPLQRIFYIDIPELVPVIVIQPIMLFGNLMNVGFEKAYLLF